MNARKVHEASKLFWSIKISLEDMTNYASITNTMSSFDFPIKSCERLPTSLEKKELIKLENN